MEAGLPLLSVSVTDSICSLEWVWIQQLPGLQMDMKRGRGAVPRIQKRGRQGVRCVHIHVTAKPGRVSSLSPLCRSYQTMLNSFLVFYHLLVGFTEKQSTNSNGGFCVKQEKILCPKTWTKQTAFSCFSKHAASVFHCSHSFSSCVAPPPCLHTL